MREALAVDAMGDTDEVTARLDRALLHAQGSGAALPVDVSMPDPERELMGALSTPLTFEEEDAGEGSRVLDELMERAGATVRVETKVEGRLVAWTTAAIGGDVASALDAAAAPADLARHAVELDRTLQARASRMRILLTTVQAAAKISFAMSTGNVLLAVPAAWRFVCSVMAEREQRRAA